MKFCELLISYLLQAVSVCYSEVPFAMKPRMIVTHML